MISTSSLDKDGHMISILQHSMFISLIKYLRSFVWYSNSLCMGNSKPSLEYMQQSGGIFLKQESMFFTIAIGSLLQNIDDILKECLELRNQNVLIELLNFKSHCRFDFMKFSMEFVYWFVLVINVSLQQLNSRNLSSCLFSFWFFKYTVHINK